MGTPYIYRCPATGMRVQGFAEPDEAPQNGRIRFVSVECAACGQIHLVDPVTGRLPSEEGED